MSLFQLSFVDKVIVIRWFATFLCWPSASNRESYILSARSCVVSANSHTPSTCSVLTSHILCCLFRFSESICSSRSYVHFAKGKKGNKTEQLRSALYLGGVCFAFPCSLKFLNLHMTVFHRAWKDGACDLTPSQFHYRKVTWNVVLFFLDRCI